jgi:hypothetical protein
VFSLALSAQASAPIRATVPIYVTRNGKVPVEADEVDFDLVYNDDILSYNNAIQPDIKYTGKTKLANGLTDRSFAMNPASDRDTIATLQFLSYLSNRDSTTLSLAHQQFIASGVQSPPCVATMDTTSSTSNFQLDLVCGDSILLSVMNGGRLPFSIQSIQPNPASSNVTVTVYGESVSGVREPGSGIEFEMFDVLGNSVLTQHSASAAEDTEHLDVSSLPSGVYFLRLSANGYVQSRQVVIER